MTGREACIDFWLRMWRGRRATVVAICLLGVARPIAAVTFQLNYVPDAINPNDPMGSGLMSIMQEAANRWMDIIEDSHTMTLNASYYVNDATGNGPCGMIIAKACAPIVMANGDGSRTDVGNVLFNANINWYIDPTPADDSEFNFRRLLYQDLTEAQQTAGYSGLGIEPLLEVGFLGDDNSSDPNLEGKFDMLSTALHEIGHHLGVTNQLQAALNETMDDDYDVPPLLLGGANMAVNAVPGNEAHFVSALPLMSSIGADLGERRLPTAADVLAAAAVSGWSQIDLPRKDFLMGTMWGGAANWEGNRVPDNQDDAFVRHGGAVAINAPATAESLLLANGSQLTVESTLTVPQQIRVVSSTMTVGMSAGAATINLKVVNGLFQVNGGTFFNSTLELQGGSVVINDGTASSDSSVLIAEGMLTIQNTGEMDSAIARIGGSTNPAQALVNGTDSLWHIISELTVGFGPNGSLNVQNGGRVESASTRIGFGNITSNGVVTVDGNTSSFSGAGPLYVGDQATGALFVLNGGDVTNTQGWVANQAGSSGEVTVSGPGSTWTNSEFVVIGFYGDGSLSVFNGGQVLNPAGSASIGNRSGSTGTVLVDGPGSAWTNNFTLFVGFEGSGDMTIRNGGSVSNTGSETAIAYSPGSDGTVLVDGAGSSWTNDVLLTVGAGGTGELTIQNGGLVSNTGSQTVIGGSAGSNGKVTVDDASFNVSVTPLVVGVLGTGELVVRNAASAQSADATVGEGPLSRGTVTVQGPDSLWQISGDLTVGDGGIGDLNILDGGEVRNRFANLSTTGGVGSATISGAGSTWINEFDLTIGAAFNSGFMTISDGGAVLSRLSIMGFNSTGRGVVEVTGPGSRWTNSSSLSVGQQGEGELTISGGGAVSNTFGFIGFLGGQGTVTVDGEGSSWTSTENVFVSANAALNIQNGGSVQSEKTMIVDGGTVTLEDGQLTGQAITLNSGAFNFTGGGLSVESFQGSLTQRGGTLAPGSSTGITTVTGNYDMLAGTFEVELAGAGGVAGSDFDQLIVRETAKLQGDLLVKLIDGFIPSVDDTFLILDPTILIGQFMGLAEGATFLADGVVFDITYLGGDGNDVVLRVSGFGLPGDYNDDGTVDAADYVVWRKNEGTTIPLPNDPIGGIIGPAQFNQWRANFGASAGNGSANRPVPEPTTLVLALIAFGAIRSIGGRARR